MARGWHLSFEQKVDRFLQKIAITDGCWEWQGFLGKGGYGRYKWSDRKNWIAHRLMYQLFLGDLPGPDIKVCHTCDNRRCVKLSHIYLDTQVGNIKDMVRKGRQRGAVGMRNVNAKLTRENVQEIRRLRREGMTQVALGQRFGVGHTAIGCIVRKETWSHVEEAE